jgi:hypothetical protein
MRSNGVPSFPDPDSSGQLSKPQVLDAQKSNPARFDAANSACCHLLPSGGTDQSQAEVQQEWREMRSFARCMRHHGVPQWPDPIDRPDGTGRPIFPIQPVDPDSPIDPTSPQIRTKLGACDSLLRTANPNRL